MIWKKLPIQSYISVYLWVRRPSSCVVNINLSVYKPKGKVLIWNCFKQYRNTCLFDISDELENWLCGASKKVITKENIVYTLDRNDISTASLKLFLLIFISIWNGSFWHKFAKWKILSLNSRLQSHLKFCLKIKFVYQKCSIKTMSNLSKNLVCTVLPIIDNRMQMRFTWRVTTDS